MGVFHVIPEMCKPVFNHVPGMENDISPNASDQSIGNGIRGINTIVTNAGIACFMFSHSISKTAFIIITPTRIIGGPTAHGERLQEEE